MAFKENAIKNKDIYIYTITIGLNYSTRQSNEITQCYVCDRFLNDQIRLIK